MANSPGYYQMPDHYKGDGLCKFTITIKDSTGVPIDITGSSAKMELSANFLKNPVFIFDTDGTGGGVLNIPVGTDGVIEVLQMESFDIIAANYNYDLQLTNSAGFVRTYLYGTWKINQDVTK